MLPKKLALYLHLALDAIRGIHGFSSSMSTSHPEPVEVYFFSLDRGQRNGDRCHCSGGAMSSQLHLGHTVPKLQGISDCTEGITQLLTAPGQSEQGENWSF